MTRAPPGRVNCCIPGRVTRPGLGADRMQDGALNDNRLGWVGTGGMGHALVTRLVEGGCDGAVYTRTRSRAEPLAELGATIVDAPADLCDRDIVFTIVA